MAEKLLVGAVTNGEYTKTQASKDATKANGTVSTSKTEEKRDTGYNKDMFLQLLVAEMQYQDPLEPSDNSQYIAQMASFTQVEALQAMQESMETVQSNSLVGKVVALNVNGQEICGKVDFVQKDDKKGMMLSVNGELYEMSKMVSVVDTDYYNAKYLASLLTDAIKKLPNPEEVTVRHEEVIAEAVSIYNSMDDYDRSFVDEDLLKKFNAVVAQFNKLMEAEKKTDTTDEESTEKVEKKKDKTEEVENTEEAEETAAEENTEIPEEETQPVDSNETVEEVEETIANPAIEAPQETAEETADSEEEEIAGTEEI